MYRLLVVAILIGWSGLHSEAQVLPDCEYATVDSAVSSASNGDTISLPAGDCTWSSRLTITKAITLLGSGVGNTIIRDGMTSGPLIVWTCVANGAHRLSGIEFVNGGSRSGIEFNGIIVINCSNSGTTTLRIDNNKFDNLNGVSLQPTNAVGVIDSNIFLQSQTNRIPVYIYHTSWDGTGSFGDASWNDGITWGGERADGNGDSLYIEDNEFTFSGVTYTCTDGYRGMRAVMRFNTLTNCSFTVHGTESGGRHRGGIGVEIYNNAATNSAGQTLSKFLNLRSGSALLFNNTATNFISGRHVALLNNHRTTAYFSAFGAADGTNQWDANMAGGPFLSGTASSAGTLTVTVSGAEWAPNEWAGYSIKKTSSCTPVQSTTVCHSIVASNTSDTITFLGTNGFSPNLSFSASDTFELYKLTAVLDGIGRTGGSLLSGTTPSLPMGWNDQTDYPLYQWLNTNNGSNFAFLAHANCIPCNANEHYYDYGGTVQTSATSPFNGTSGVGVGTLANRPTTCTTGVFYWATDQGSWNSSGSGGQGLGYKCTATDTWATGANIYTPYDYPHPLTQTVSISSIDPAFGQQGATVAVTLTGLGFEGGNATINAISGITINSTTVVSDTSITASFVIDGGATLGNRNVTVTTDEGTSNAVTFEVLASGSVPTITSITPSSGARGATVPIALVGTNFTGGSVSISGSGVTASDCNVASAVSITCNFVIDANTGWGLRTVTVTNGSGTSNTANFFVRAPTTYSLLRFGR